MRLSTPSAAVLAHLTPLLVELSRLATDVVGDLRLKDELLLAGVFGFIEERYRQQISLKEVARAVGLSPGHLTTVVRRKTGRIVLEWISGRLSVETALLTKETGRRVRRRALLREGVPPRPRHHPARLAPRRPLMKPSHTHLHGRGRWFDPDIAHPLKTLKRLSR